MKNRVIRIRQLPYAEASCKLESELNEAFMNGESRVSVLHGIGSGELKRMTVEMANRLDFVRLMIGFPFENNPGVTELEILVADRSFIRKIRHNY